MSVQAVAPAEPVPPGGVVRVTLKVAIPASYHIYAVTPNPDVEPTRIDLDASLPATLGEVRAPAAKHHRLEIGDYVQEYDYYEGTVEFGVPVTIAPTASTGEMELRGTFHSMSCTEQFCDPPDSVPWSVRVRVEGAPVAAAPDPPKPVPPPPSAPPPGEEEAARAQGFLYFLAVAFAAGLASLATPCVWPLIPVTLSFFTKQSGGSYAGTLSLLVVYCFGIMLSFCGLGFVLTMLLGAEGVNIFAQNAWVNLAIALLFVVFALSFFGLFDITLPSFLTDRLQVRNRAGTVGALALGLTFAVVSFTCTAPFVATILAWATLGDYLWPFAGMLSFSAAMALPFFVLGLFPKMAHSFAGGGGWLHATKVVMGFIELAAAFKFLFNADWKWTGGEYFTRPVVLSVWAACAGFSALYLTGLMKMGEEESPAPIGVTRMLFGLCFATIGLWLLTGLFGAHLGLVEGYLPPRRAGELGTGGGGGESGAQKWFDDYEQARLSAIASKKPIFLEFTAAS
ncbi:MAG: hypothetical protein HYY93_14375 [Planctomycetes bacterium]|nr:hypothetical protein [Planctomycetota bacterium]